MERAGTCDNERNTDYLARDHPTVVAKSNQNLRADENVEIKGPALFCCLAEAAQCCWPCVTVRCCPFSSSRPSSNMTDKKSVFVEAVGASDDVIIP